MIPIRALALAALCAFSLAAQPAVFPGSVATPQTFGVVTDNLQTLLAVGSDAATLTFQLAAPVPVNSIVTIDNEQMQVQSVVGNQATMFARGMFGTAAAAHAANAVAAVLIVSHNLNQLYSEVQAIETKLHAESPSVRDYGAHCAGDSNVDDKAAIQAAITAASSAGGGTVRFPVGVCYIGSSITLPTRVALAGVPASPGYGVTPGGLSVVRAIAGVFPSGGIMINAQHATDTAIADLTIVGNSVAQTTTQNDATSVGIWYGNDGTGTDTGTYPRHLLRNVSVSMNKVGVAASGAGYFWGSQVNIGSNWYIGIKAYGYGLNDSTFSGLYINSGYGSATPSDDYTGTGLYLGSGSANVNVAGGKIEWNGTGVFIDSNPSFSTAVDANFNIHITGMVFDSNTKWSVRVRNSNAFLVTTAVDVEHNLFVASGSAQSGGNSSHIFLDGGGQINAPIHVQIDGNTFASAPAGNSYPYGDGAKYPTDAAISALNGGALQLQINGNDFTTGAASNRIYTDSSINAGSQIWESGNKGAYSWAIGVAGVVPVTRFAAALVGGGSTSDGSTMTVQGTFAPTRLRVMNAASQGSTNAFELTGSDGTLQTWITGGGTLFTRRLNQVSDMGQIATIGRYNPGFAGAVLDFADPLGGGLTPTFASIRVGGTEQLRITSSGITSPAGGTFGGNLVFLTQIALTSFQSPADNATCTTGTLTWDYNYIYVCTSSNTWKRSALASY